MLKDNGFKSDIDKINIKETLKTNGIDEFITIQHFKCLQKKCLHQKHLILISIME